MVFERPQGAPEECEWSKDCSEVPSVELYEYSDGDEELWVCEAHFAESMYTKPPSEYDVNDMLFCRKCGKNFEKIDSNGSDRYQPVCDCEHLENVEVLVG